MRHNTLAHTRRLVAALALLAYAHAFSFLLSPALVSRGINTAFAPAATACGRSRGVIIAEAARHGLGSVVSGRALVRPSAAASAHRVPSTLAATTARRRASPGPLHAVGLFNQERPPLAWSKVTYFFRALLKLFTRALPVLSSRAAAPYVPSMAASMGTYTTSRSGAFGSATVRQERREEQHAQQQQAGVVDDLTHSSVGLDQRPPPGSHMGASSRLMAWALEQVIYRAALRVQGLDVLVESAADRLKTVWLSFNTLALPCGQLTGGASVVVTGVDLNLAMLMNRKLGAFKRPFQVRGEYVFTNNDFIASPAVRNLVQSIMTSTFARLGLGDVRVSRVGLQGDRITIQGHSSLLQRFSCSAELNISGDGHVVALRHLTYGNQAGEYLFQTPWSLGSRLPKDLVSCDMGDNTCIESLTIKKGKLRLRGYFIVSPTPPLIVADVGKRGMVRYDVGERVSALISDILDNALQWRALRVW